jgi:hypothetical protein
MAAENFKLVLEGMIEDSPESLRKIKGALLGDLGLSAAEAQHALESIPCTLSSAPSEAALEAHHTKLHAAGAKVTIVRPVTDGSTPIEGELDFFLAPTATPPPPHQDGSDLEIIETALDFCFEDPLSLNAGRPQEIHTPGEAARQNEVSFEIAPPEDVVQFQAVPNETGACTAVTASAPAVAQPLQPAVSSQATEAPEHPPTEQVPAQSNSVSFIGKVVESPHHIPIGRTMRCAPKASSKGATEAISLETDAPILTPELITGLSVAVTLLALCNWVVLAG